MQPETLHTIKLIGFGQSKHITRNKSFNAPQNKHDHIPKGFCDQYGNMLLASKSSVQKRVLCRRDDLQSLIYLLMSLETGYFAIDIHDHWETRKDMFRRTVLEKLYMPTEEYCQKRKCPHYTEILQTIDQIGFTEKPDYEHLRFLLIKNLLDKGLVPDEKMDWNAHVRYPLIEEEKNNDN